MRESDRLDVDGSAVLLIGVGCSVEPLCGVDCRLEDTVTDDCVCEGKVDDISESGTKTPGRDSLDVEGESVAESDSGGEVVGVGVGIVVVVGDVELMTIVT